MSTEDRTVIIDKTDQEKSSGEAVLILAIVIGFFLVILIALCMLRHWKKIKRKIFTSKESSRGSHSRGQASWTASTGPTIYASKSLTDRSLVMICDENMRSVRGVEHARYTLNPTNSNNYYSYQISDNGQHRKSLQWEYNSKQSHEHSSTIYQSESTISSQYDCPHDKTTRCASEATDLSTSMEMLEESDQYRMYGDNVKRKQYYHYNWTPEGRPALNYPNSESQIASNSVLKIPLSGVNVFRSPHNVGNHNKWKLFGEDTTNSGSTIRPYTSSEIVSSPGGNDTRLWGERYDAIDEDAAIRKEQGTRNTVRISTPPSVENLKAVEIALDTPLFERDESATKSSDITQYHFGTGEKDKLQTTKNRHPNRNSIEMLHGIQDERSTTSSYDNEDESTQRRGNARKKTYQGVDDEGNAPWMVSEEEEEVNTTRRSKVYQGYRSTAGMRSHM